MFNVDSVRFYAFFKEWQPPSLSPEYLERIKYNFIFKTSLISLNIYFGTLFSFRAVSLLTILLIKYSPMIFKHY
jgi:hypothetical protein